MTDASCEVKWNHQHQLGGVVFESKTAKSKKKERFDSLLTVGNWLPHLMEDYIASFMYTLLYFSYFTEFVLV